MPTAIDTLAQRPEVAAWLEKRQSELQITKTTKTPSGKTLDWVPLESQVAGPIATAPQTEAAHAPIDPERQTKGVTFDLGEPGPAGHVPILRPDLSKLSVDFSLEKTFAKRGGLRLNKQRPNKHPTDPDPAGYFHATTGQTVTNYGCDAWYNVWDPRVDIPSSPGDDHSISQTWIQNYQVPSTPTTGTHSVEAGLTVDHSLNGDSANHLFAYYTNNGYKQDGDNQGSYNRLHKGWVQTHATIFPGIRINGASTQGAGSQLEIGLKFQYSGGNWWLGFNNNESGPWIWLGYYPAALFTNGLAHFGQWVSFGGEVYSALANPCGTQDDMGSGRKAAAGFSHAAFQRNLRYGINGSGAMTDFNGAAEVDKAAAGCPNNQYSIDAHMNSGSSWASYQYFGGQSS